MQVTNTLIQEYPSTPTEVSKNLLESIWTASKYLIGSTTKTIPYELVYALSTALRDWNIGNNIVTTALIDEFNFYFQGIDPNFKKLVKSYLTIEISHDLIQIALPKLYIHKPLYSIPLYHELGHFIDNHKRITSYSRLLHPLPGKYHEQVEVAHRQEFFADIFSASYTGLASVIFLNEFAANAVETHSHPSTKQRVEVMTSFLEGKSNGITDIFYNTLTKLGLPPLMRRYEVPKLVECFNNIRPYCIKNKKELHGILEAGWNYLLTRDSEPDSGFNEISDEFEPAKIINDLIEKSIRNMILQEKWDNGSTN